MTRRPANIDPAKHARAILKLLVEKLRAKWPGAKIIFRGDSGFCRWKLMRWYDRHEMHYIIALFDTPHAVIARVLRRSPERSCWHPPAIFDRCARLGKRRASATAWMLGKCDALGQPRSAYVVGGAVQRLLWSDLASECILSSRWECWFDRRGCKAIWRRLRFLIELPTAEQLI